IFGQYEWSGCPAVPPELVLLPDWAPFNIYRMSSWSRAIVVPLSIIWAYRPNCPVPPRAAIAELRVDRPRPRRSGFQFRPKERFWKTAFNAIDRTIKTLDTLDWRPFRRQGLKQAEAWILERLEKSDGLAAIFPPIINTILALRCLGYPADHPAVAG